METELFVHFAEIAGVFVGFGALITLRSEHRSDLHDVAYLQGVLGLGVWVMITALVPIAVGRYGVHDHPLWLSCALFSLAVWATFLFIYGRTPDMKAFNRSLEPWDRYFHLLELPLHVVIAGSLLLVIFGVRPGVDEALYVTALTAGVVFAGYALLALVLSQKHVPPPDRDSG